MKYVFLLAFFTCGFFNVVFCQPTLTGANSNPVGGDKFFLYNCPNQLSINSPGPGGANVLWNYSNLIVHGIDSISYFSCENVPSCGLFPGSNIYWPTGVGDAFYSYYTANNDSFSIAGYIDTAITYDYIHQQWDTTVQIMNPTPSGVLMRYPSTYNSNFIINYMTQALDSFYEYGSRSYTGDAYSTLILPSGTFNNVLRVHETDLWTDSIISNGTSHTIPEREENYYWYMPNFHHWLLNMEVDFNVTLTPTDTGFTFVTDTALENLAVKQVGLQKPYCTVYPNPASGLVNIKFVNEEQEQVYIDVYDMVGRKAAMICDQAFSKGGQEINYDVSKLPAGMYMLRVQNGTGVEVKKLEVRR